MNNQNCKATRNQPTQIMGPPSKRKTKRRSRNWSSQLGFLFFSLLFLTLSIQRNNVNAETDDAVRFDPSSTVAPNTSTSPHSGLNITGEDRHAQREFSSFFINLLFLRFLLGSSWYLPCTTLFIYILSFAKEKKRKK